jgi:ribonuclease E
VAEGTKPKKSADDDDRTQQVDQREIRALMNKTFGNVSTTPPPAGENEETVVGPKAAGLPSEPKLAKASDVKEEAKVDEPETNPILEPKASDAKQDGEPKNDAKPEELKAEEPKANDDAKAEEPKANDDAKAEEPKANDDAKAEEPKANEDAKAVAAAKSEAPAAAQAEQPRMGLTLVLVAIAIAALIWAMTRG